MFVFNRTTRSADAEHFEIETSPLMPRPERFGQPTSDHREQTFRRLGSLTLLFRDHEVEYHLAVKEGLDDDEVSELYREIERLAGKTVHAWGGELEPMLVARDCLINPDQPVVSTGTEDGRSQ